MSCEEHEIIHRVRNEGTEKDLPEGKLCDGTLLLANERGSVINQDVTCLKCLAVLLDLKIIKITTNSEPFVFTCQCVHGSEQYYSQIIIGQEHDPVDSKLLKAIWMSQGDKVFYLGRKNTLNLRDYCNAVLNDQGSGLPSTEKR